VSTVTGCTTGRGWGSSIEAGTAMAMTPTTAVAAKAARTARGAARRVLVSSGAWIVPVSVCMSTLLVRDGIASWRRT